jgi:Ca-activated chloride channel homolog
MGRIGRNGVSLFLLALPLLVVPPIQPVPPSPSDQPTFKSGSTELVVLPVVVTDKQGRFVSDLDQERFTVYDNGRKMPVELFTNEDTPVTVGLVLDASGSMRHKIGYVVAAAVRFARLSNPDDELFAVRFNDDVRDALRDHHFVLAGDGAALESSLMALVPDGMTSLYDALMVGLDRAAEGTRSRKVLIVVSDGGDTASDATLDEVLARARASNVTIYTIGLFEPDDPDRNPGVLKELAQTTGGERFLPRSAGPLMQACEQIAREIRSGYTLGYVPPARDGAYHRLRVQVESSDRRLSVRTRPGYFAGRDGTHD